MSKDLAISPSIIEAQQREVDSDYLSELNRLEKLRDDAETQMRHADADILQLKENRRKSIKIPWKESSYWCVEVDADNPYYFLKSSMGVAHCVAYKNAVDIDATIKSKVATSLSWLFINKKIGRVEYKGTKYYGLPQFFNKDEDGDYTILKGKYQKDIDLLKEVTKSYRKK